MTSVNHIQQRKSRHLDVCLDASASIESTDTWFQDIRLVHHPLPELDWAELDTSTDFLGHHLALPFFISCMTGGSEAGARVNRHLVQAAQQTGIPVGLGSMRVLLRHPDLFDQFHVKPLAPDVPVWANLSAAQLQHLATDDLIEWLKRLEVQALVLHCNVGQEQFQPHGDRCFAGMTHSIRQFCERSPIPVLVKETGFGLRAQDIQPLARAGVAAVDIAGAGGTNWILVESQCHDHPHPDAALDFSDWGNPTPIVLAAMDESDLPVLASGGVRNGVDIAKSLALGASLAGLALPFIRAEAQGGLDGVLEQIETLTLTLKTAMLLTGSRTVADLGTSGLILSESFVSQVHQHKQPQQWRTLVRSRP
ncbi:MAG: type 2 isopentenyl-diphosphate Delta-isomerase [Phycisphaerae bacterium]|nr:type 2 isopentenyl-diphosphate Delta-isomerase [Phycisphaerae bacterium]